MHPATSYWDRGVAMVPVMTGAEPVMDGSDILSVLDAFGMTRPLQNVLDVGCGTGRMAAHCEGYHGVDIAPSAVAFCRLRDLSADLISGPADLVADADHPPAIGLVLCLSVFTHINRPERQAYLRAFRKLSRALLVDIIPGDEGGNVALWTAEPERFRNDLTAAGYAGPRWTVDRTSLDGVTHRYFWIPG